jgi:RNA polymerase-binding transcription factor DksA
MSLTDGQRAHLEHRLVEERERVIAMLRDIERRFSQTERDEDGDLSTVPLHPADKGTDAFGRELDAAEETRISGELAEIDAALERLYRAPERFGRDERTGEEIPFERLELIPRARARSG